MPQQHETGPLAILEALRSLDLDKLEEQTKNDLKGGSKSKRSEYVKRLNAIKGLRRTGVAPGELMITSVPVIPPKFRPFAQQGDTMIAGDANILYKDFIEQNDAFKQEREMFGDNNAGQGRLDLYDTAKALYGYGDPIKDKSKQKDVRGFLKKIVGRTSKQGFFQSKMIAKPMDSVGRSTIIVDPELGMDEIGLPKDLAMTMYAPHVQRRLRQSGLADTDALKHVKNMTPQALHALEKEMEVRPVVYSRAPAWYQHNIIGGNPRLIDGDAISISPAVTSGLSADFDGDQQIGRGLIALDFEAIRDILPEFYEKYKDCALHSLNPAVTCANANEAYNDMYKHIETVVNIGKSVVAIDFEDFPHTTLSNVRKDDKYDIEFYNVPDGIQVAAYDENTHQLVWTPVKYWSIHRGKSVEIVTLDDDTQIYTDDDPRAVYGIAKDAESLTPQRFTPSEAVKHGVMVPQCSKGLARLVDDGPVKYFNFETAQLQDTQEGKLTVPVDFELGQMLGIMAGDGWCDKRSGGTFHVSDNEGYNAKYVLDYLDRHELIEYVYTTEHVFKREEHTDRYGDTVRYTFNGNGRYVICKAIAAVIGGAGNKHWPVWFATAGSGFLRGFVNGLVATDGSVSLSSKPDRDHDQLLVQLTSTSLRMLRETKEALALLGVQSSITFSKTTKADNDAWILSVSTPGAERENLLVDCCNERKAKTFLEAKVDMSPTSLRGNYVPLPGIVASIINEGTVCPKVSKAFREGPVGSQFSEEEWAARKETAGKVTSFYKEIKNGYMTKVRAGIMLDILRSEDAKRAGVYAAGVAALNKLEANGGLGEKADYEAITQGVYTLYSCGDVKNPDRLVLVNSAKYRKGKRMPQAAIQRLKTAFATRKSWTYADNPVILEWEKLVESNVNWRYITEVEKTGKVETGYDLTVPGYETFMNTEGVILSNTINVHVPASDSAVAETYEKLMPSSHPYDDRSGESIKPKMKQEQVLGMYDLATRPASGTYKFKTQSEALAAVKAGDIPLDADLEIEDMKGQEKVAEFVHQPIMEEPAVDLDSPVDEQVLKAVEIMYGVKVPKVVARQFAKARDLVGYVTRLGEMQKEAAGKIMKVWVSDMHTGSRYLRMMRFAVYMPDCAEYRGIIAGEDSKAKAVLAKKFWLNRGDNVEFEECSLEIGE